MKSTKKQEFDVDEFWYRPDSIMLPADIRLQGETCDLCKKEEANLELAIRVSPTSKKRLVLKTGYSCAIGLEATLRHFRKWSIRGGASK